MRLSTPRLKPLTRSEYSDAQREILAPLERGDDPPYNIFTTLAHHPRGAAAFLVWGTYALRNSLLPDRYRELIILRIGVLGRSGYEWAQHVRLTQRIGFTSEDYARIKRGSTAEGWNDQERAVLQAAEELFRDQFIATATWNALQQFLTDPQRMDVVFVVGHYMQVCMALNTFGVQLDAGLSADPDFVATE